MNINVRITQHLLVQTVPEDSLANVRVLRKKVGPLLVLDQVAIGLDGSCLQDGGHQDLVVWVLVLHFEYLLEKVKQLLRFTCMSEYLVILLLIHDANQVQDGNRSVDFKN